MPLSKLARSLAIVLLLASCVPKYAGLPERPPAQPPSVPVIFVPGVTGVVLRDSRTGEVVWGEGRNLLGPDDDGSRLALGPQDALEPAGPIHEIRLFGIQKPIYGPLRSLLVRAGYVPGETLFFYGYDWRRDLAESAGRLREWLEELRRKQGRERLEVDLVCQSSGAHLCRYLAKYDLPPALAVRRLVLVGASNGGSLRIATVASQDWLSPQERAALALPPRRVKGGHFEALLTVEAGRFLLEALSP